MIQLWRGNDWVIAVVVAAIYFLWLAVAMLPSASETLRLAAILGSDEVRHATIIRYALSRGDFFIDFGAYGHLPFNLALAALTVADRFGNVSDQAIIIALRMVSAAAGFGTMLMAFFLARRFFPPLVSWLTLTVLSVASTSLIRWSFYSHPDIPQVFFLMVTLFFCCRLGRDNGRGSLVAASASAGLVFACKYIGVFMLPVIWLVAISRDLANGEDDSASAAAKRNGWIRGLVLLAGLVCGVLALSISADLVARWFSADGLIETASLPLIEAARVRLGIAGGVLLGIGIFSWPWNRMADSPLLSRSLRQITLSATVFVGAFLVTSPYSLWRLNFLQGIVAESGHVAFGHILREEGGVVGWMGLLGSDELLGIPLAVLAGFGFLLVLHETVKIAPRSWRNAAAQLTKPEVILWFWVLLYLTFLVLRVRMLAPRFLLPVLPVLIVLAMMSIWRMAQMVRAGHHFRRATLTLFFLGLLGAAEATRKISLMVDYRAAVRDRVANSSAVRAGAWLEQTFDTASRIFADKYSYVPPAFQDYHRTGGGTIADLRAFHPDVVIVTNEISQRFLDPANADNYRHGAERYLEHVEYYRHLRNGSLGFRPAADFGGVQIFVSCPDG